MFDKKISPDAWDVLHAAEVAARSAGHRQVGAAHLVVGCLAVPSSAAAQVLMGRGLTASRMQARLAGLAVPQPAGPSPQHLDATGTRAVAHALQLMAWAGTGRVTADMLAVAALDVGDQLTALMLSGFGVDPATVAAELQRATNLPRRAEDAPLSPPAPAAPPAEPGPQPAMASAGPAGSSPLTRRRSDQPSAIASFAVDLVAEATAGHLDPVFGRDAEIERMMAVLVRRTKNCPVLLGEPGVGKTAVVEGLAARIAAGEVPEPLQGLRLWSVDIGSLVAGTTYRGDFEERLKKLVAELKGSGDLAFFDEVHSVVGAGAAGGSISAGSMLKPLLARGELKMIGATTFDEYRRHIESDKAMARRFQAVKVDAPTPAQAVTILGGLRARYEAHHGVRFSDDALAAAVDLSVRYVPDRHLPDKAIDLLDEAGAAAGMAVAYAAGPLGEALVARSEMIRAAGARRSPAADAAEVELTARVAALLAGGTADPGRVDAAAVAAVVAAVTGQPVGSVSVDEASTLLGLEATLSQTVVGQPEAASALARALRRRRSGIADTTRPPSFVFAGRTGVGKSEMAKAAAEALFGPASLIQIDMSEYMEKHSESRLIGAPPGYVGHDSGGQLTEAVRRRPHSVVLFDEIEKAHPDVFDLLLQLLEDGRLTDGAGRAVDFSHTVVVMTTNLGVTATDGRAAGFSRHADADLKSRRKAIDDALRSTFRTEFLNRVDEVVYFNDLTRADIDAIVDLQMARVLSQAAEAGYQVTLSPTARDLVAAAGFDPLLGARPLRRAIQSLVEDPLALAILEGLERGPVALEASSDGESLAVLAVPVASVALPVA